MPRFFGSCPTPWPDRSFRITAAGLVCSPKTDPPERAERDTVRKEKRHAPKTPLQRKADHPLDSRGRRRSGIGGRCRAAHRSASSNRGEVAKQIRRDERHGSHEASTARRRKPPFEARSRGANARQSGLARDRRKKVLTPAQKRLGRQYLRERGYSERRACRVLGLARSTARYRSHGRSSDDVLKRIRTLASEWIGVGYRIVHDRLRAEGMVVNHKRVLRLWRQAGLDRRIKRRRPRIRRDPVPQLEAAQRANERWALDFLSDRLENGQPYRILAIVDVCTRECLAITAARSMPAWRVVAVLDGLALVRGLPDMITLDNGPELTSKALRIWAAANNVTLRYSRPGTPT